MDNALVRTLSEPQQQQEESKNSAGLLTAALLEALRLVPNRWLPFLQPYKTFASRHPIVFHTGVGATAGGVSQLAGGTSWPTGAALGAGFAVPAAWFEKTVEQKVPSIGRFELRNLRKRLGLPAQTEPEYSRLMQSAEEAAARFVSGRTLPEIGFPHRMEVLDQVDQVVRGIESEYGVQLGESHRRRIASILGNWASAAASYDQSLGSPGRLYASTAVEQLSQRVLKAFDPKNPAASATSLHAVRELSGAEPSLQQAVRASVFGELLKAASKSRGEGISASTYSFQHAGPLEIYEFLAPGKGEELRKILVNLNKADEAMKRYGIRFVITPAGFMLVAAMIAKAGPLETALAGLGGLAAAFLGTNRILNALTDERDPAARMLKGLAQASKIAPGILAGAAIDLLGSEIKEGRGLVYDREVEDLKDKLGLDTGEEDQVQSKRGAAQPKRPGPPPGGTGIGPIQPPRRE